MKKQWMKKLNRLEHLLHQYYRHGSYGGGSYRGQGRILSLLNLKTEISQRELTHLLDMRKQSLGELLTKLELKGLITREPSPEDRRVMNVTLTDAGKIAAESLEAEQRERKDIFAVLKSEDQDTFLRCLEQLIAALEAEMGEELEHKHDRPPGHWKRRGRSSREKYYEENN